MGSSVIPDSIVGSRMAKEVTHNLDGGERRGVRAHHEDVLPVSEAVNCYEEVLASIVCKIHNDLLEWACRTWLGDDWFFWM